MENKNLKREFEKLVPQNIRNVLEICSQAAEELSLPIFLIGGAVRDIIINADHFDTDVTVQGNAVDFARFLEKKHPDICKIKEIHESFKTAKVIFSINEKIAMPHPIDAPRNDRILIILDIASTRKESYPYPGSLPKVEEIGCELYEDVKRRDFSINSMALSLNKNNFGDLIDYLGGYDDIKKKKMQVLHEKSFLDDPTRIIRALKFRARFGYKLDETTKQLQVECLKSGIFDNLCGERIKSELKQTFNLNKSECTEIFVNENIYRLVDKEIIFPENYAKTCESIIAEYSDFINSDFIWLIYLGVLLSNFSKEKIALIAEKLYLSGNETDVLTKAKTLLEKTAIKENSTNFEIYEYFEGFSPESILIFLIKKSELKEKTDIYLKELKDIKIHTTGETLINSGLKPSPVFGEILRKLLKARINGEFSSVEEEKEFLKILVSLN